MEIGRYNKLRVSRVVDFGVYLADDAGNEVLLPAKYCTAEMTPGTETEVFVYTDSEDRPVATTLRPKATVGQVAWLDVAAVNDTGAFMDWGLEKDLLVPYREQRARMKEGGRYGVYVYLDDASHRVAATARLEKYIGSVFPAYRRFAEVTAVVIGRTDLGYKAVVDHLHWGMIYDDELHGRDIEPGTAVRAWVRKVRDDGKLDLTLHAPAADRADSLGAMILRRMRSAGGTLDLNDRSDPGLIGAALGCSKKDFKKALGYLLRTGKITKSSDGFKLC